MVNLDCIHIRDLQLRCVVGIYPEERKEKQDVAINIILHTDLRKAGQSDDINDTVDYKAIKKEVARMVEQSSFLLIERLAEEVSAIALKPEGVNAVDVTVDKPGALRFARSVAVEIHRQRTGA